MTLIRLDNGSRQTFVLPAPPLGVAFTSDNRALVVTSTEFLLYRPGDGRPEPAGARWRTWSPATLPVPPANFPPQIMAASLAASGDGERIYGLTDTSPVSIRPPSRGACSCMRLRLRRRRRGRRVVSVSRDGSYYAAGWGLFDAAAR